MIKIHPNMKEYYEGTVFGILAMKITGEQREEAFQKKIEEELQSIRKAHSEYERKAFCETNEVVKPYVQYYKKFKKTYHVLPQLESILRGKDFPHTTPLIQALFLAELKTSLLIAGHDLKKCPLPLTIQMCQGGETFFGSGNRRVELKPNDICLKDEKDFHLSIIYGQDERSRITPKTGEVLFLIDGVPGLRETYVEEGLQTLYNYVKVFAPDSILLEMRTFSVSPKAGEKP
ncbi:hypothetical protein [Anaerotignum sp. MB30-C6]|uniref:hypothetical protein n=1 Tax=Anaerotignum sp. MB30-C6 TaxID=3070814 RepID=UPI0027DC9BBD|nr:hypothetical protein [Anaerotignum sp. MB30-C6]WMI82226.1 hypothetical protein RBQ60_05680 [Anaerotignum sp. MB30-C6]